MAFTLHGGQNVGAKLQNWLADLSGTFVESMYIVTRAFSVPSVADELRGVQPVVGTGRLEEPKCVSSAHVNINIFYFSLYTSLRMHRCMAAWLTGSVLKCQESALLCH